MPIYEYACAACGHTFEEWQKMSDPPVRTCPKCKKKKVEKLISQTSFQLKGGGWYGDLYASSKPGSKDKDSGADAKSGSDSGGKDGGGADKDSGGTTTAKPDAAKSTKADAKDAKGAKKKDSPKKSEARAA